MTPPWTGSRIVLVTVLAMLAFASNSILCRLALTSTTIDAASFTAIRLVSGALILVAILRQPDRREARDRKSTRLNSSHQI
jgi:threonine/homoserine efflux transporter RhtA